MPAKPAKLLLGSFHVTGTGVRRVFRSVVLALRRPFHGRPSRFGAMALTKGGALAIACCLGSPERAFGASPQQENPRPGEAQQEAGRRDGDAERKLLADLLAADASSAKHFDRPQLDRELAAAFRSYGLDLDVVDPKTAGRGSLVTRRRPRSPRRSTCGSVCVTRL